jgi:outer membrane protein insertion porin family
MLGAALLLVALGVAPTADGPYVRAVRIEGARGERLERFVGLVPGSPLDPDEVRLAVELIHATGHYEDVRVELERDADEEGVTVVFRPRPAPLLAHVRVEGDAVLSPRAIRGVTRLRNGEPLWAARLERAGRDAALALVGRGYLEATVAAKAVAASGGADAVFTVRSGPLARVRHTRVVGEDAPPPLPLEDLVEPRAGEVYKKQRAEKAREAMRRRLVTAERWSAHVEITDTYDPATARMGLVFRVRAGPPFRLEVSGAEVSSRLRDRIETILRDGQVGVDALEAGAERLEDDLRQDGYREARARHRREARGGGEAVVYEVTPGPRAFASTVEVDGAEVDARGLRTAVGAPIVDAALDEDARTLTSRLQDAGHFGAVVEADVAEGGGHLPVRFLARPGPRAVRADVAIDTPPLPPGSEGEGLEELPLRAGQPYRRRDLAAASDRLASVWRRAGYLEAEVRAEVELSEDETQARVRLVIEPGPRTIVDHIVLAGLRDTRERTVRREMELRPGEAFSFERVLESQRRLSGLGIFERVAISELDRERKRRRDVVVSLQEAPRTTVTWGVGYSEQDLLRGSVEVTRRNLSGLGRSASLFARGSFRGSRFLFNYREPWLFGRRLDSFLTAFWEEEDRKSFDYNRKGAIAQSGLALDRRTTLILRYLLQDTHVFNLEVPEEEIDRQFRTYTVSGPSGSVVWDRRDDPLEPTRGSFLGADTQLSLEALGGAPYIKGFFQATSVRPVRSGLALVLSARVGLAGTIGETSPSLLPLPERFFAGGDYGPRGFPVDEVGPFVIGSDGEPIYTGGNALLLGGAELRLNLTRHFQVAGFLDLGNVYLLVSDIDLSDLRESAGVGLRYRTPIGPVRLDWGYVLDRRAWESPSRFHFTIGHAF